MRHCRRENKATEKSLVQFSHTLERFQASDARFETVQSQLKELEGVDMSVMKQIYDYKMDERSLEAEEAVNLTKEYKLHYLDPATYVTRLHKRMAWKNATKAKMAIKHKYK